MKVTGWWRPAQIEPGIDGAFISRSHASQLVNIIGVDPVVDYLERAARAGAKIRRDKQEIPNVGFAGYIQDPEGNTVGLFESVMEVRDRHP